MAERPRPTVHTDPGLSRLRRLAARAVGCCVTGAISTGDPGFEMAVSASGAALGLGVIVVGVLLLACGRFRPPSTAAVPSIEEVIDTLLPPDLEDTGREDQRALLRRYIGKPPTGEDEMASDQKAVQWYSKLKRKDIREDMDRVKATHVDRQIEMLRVLLKEYPLVQSQLEPCYKRHLTTLLSYSAELHAVASVLDIATDCLTAFKDYARDPVAMDDLFPASVACLIVSTSISLVGTLYFVFCAKTEEGRLINTRELSDGIAKYTWLLLISASNPETLALMPWRDPLTAKRSFGGLPNPQAAVFCTVAATLETVPQTVINILYQQRSEEVAWNVQMQVGLSVLTFTVHVLGRYLMACLNQTRRAGTAVEQASGSGVSHQKHSKEHSKEHMKKDSGSRQELIKEMEATGLTEEDQEKLIQEQGVDTVELFRELDDDDFEQCGIDINARKQTKAAENADHEAQLSRNISKEKRDEARRERDHEMQRDKDDLVKLLDAEGSLTAEGRSLIQQEVPNLRRLFSLDKESMNTIGLKLKDKKALHKLLESSPDPTLQTGRKNLPKLERALASTPFGAFVFFFAAPSVLPVVYSTIGTVLCAHGTRRLTRCLLAL
eukprot:COSAG06_NODE_23_length_33072_cov_44.622327_23_plen_608_part_00